MTPGISFSFGFLFKSYFIFHKKWEILTILKRHTIFYHVSLQISDTLQAGFEPAQNLNSDFVEWGCAVKKKHIFAIGFDGSDGKSSFVKFIFSLFSMVLMFFRFALIFILFSLIRKSWGFCSPFQWDGVCL